MKRNNLLFREKFFFILRKEIDKYKACINELKSENNDLRMRIDNRTAENSIPTQNENQEVDKLKKELQEYKHCITCNFFL